MKDLIKEVAQFVVESGFGARENDWASHAVFLEDALAELSKRAEAVVCWKDSEARNRVIFPPMRPESGDDGWLPLFTFPPIHDIEAIENRVAEACAKACIKEAVQIVIDGPEERAYNNATSDCAEAIRSEEWRKYK